MVLVHIIRKSFKYTKCLIVNIISYLTFDKLKKVFGEIKFNRKT